MKIKRHKKRGSAVNIIAMITLIIAWWVGSVHEVGMLPLVTKHYPEATIKAQSGSEYAYTVSNTEGDSTVYIASGKGYGGPLVVKFMTDSRNRITDLELLDHVDTPGYVANVKSQFFLNQFERKLISDDFGVGHDIDGVSGATLTAKGITEAVRASAHVIATRNGMAREWIGERYHFEPADAVLAILVLLALLERYLPNKVRKYHLVYMGMASVLVIGYWSNTSLSLATLSAIALGYWPDLLSHSALYILLSGVVIGVVWLGRNIYCSQLCPFHHIQRWTYKLGKNNWPIYGVLRRHSQHFLNIILWLALVLTFVSRNPALGSYEPFSMLFSLEGVGVQWYILPLALIGAFFIKDYWCRLFCPVGRCLNIAVTRRNKWHKQAKHRISVKMVESK